MDVQVSTAVASFSFVAPAKKKRRDGGALLMIESSLYKESSDMVFMVVFLY